MSTPHTPATGLPAVPPPMPPRPRSQPGGWLAAVIAARGAAGSDGRVRRGKHTVAPDVVTFHATCPGCGILAKWTESLEDTRIKILIDCRICDRRARRRLADSA